MAGKSIQLLYDICRSEKNPGILEIATQLTQNFTRFVFSELIVPVRTKLLILNIFNMENEKYFHRKNSEIPISQTEVTGTIKHAYKHYSLL